MGKRKRKRVEKPAPKGVDFGIEAHALLVGSMDFVSELQRADILGIGYGVTFSKELGTRLPQVSLLAKDSESIVRAFKQFGQWGAKSDGDVVDMTFVFLDAGGYLVGIGPQIHGLTQRVSRFDRTLSPIVVGATWTKHLDTRGPSVDQFRLHKRKPVSPFILNAAAYDGEAKKESVDPERIRLCPEVEGILKFECTFVDEKDVKENTSASTMLRGHQGKLPRGPQLSSNRSRMKDGKPEDCLKRREETFRRHFPVTRGRLLQENRYLSHFADLAEKGVRHWQFEQAMINLTLSMTLANGEKHYNSISAEDLHRRIVDHLHSRFEIADSKDPLTGVTPEDVQKQIVLDASSLLKDFGIPSLPSDLNSLQILLAKHRLLD